MTPIPVTGRYRVLLMAMGRTRAVGVGEVILGGVVFVVSFPAGFFGGALFEMRHVRTAVKETLTQAGATIPRQKRHHL